MMTTMAALLGGLPLAHAGLWFRICADTWRRDCSGLIVSQMLTLFITPVIYLYLDSLRLWGLRFSGASPAIELRPAAV